MAKQFFYEFFRISKILQKFRILTNFKTESHEFSNYVLLYLRFFYFELEARTGQTDRRTDGRTGGQDP